MLADGNMCHYIHPGEVVVSVERERASEALPGRESTALEEKNRAVT